MNHINNYNSNSDIDNLCYKIPYWDYQQWLDYAYQCPEYENIEHLGTERTDLFPVFMSEIFERLLRCDKVEKTFDTSETFTEKKELWEKSLEVWQKDLIDSGIGESEYVRIFGDKPVKPEFNKPKNEIQWAVKVHGEISSSDEWNDLMFKISGEQNHLKRWILAGVGAMVFSEVCARKLPKPERKLIDPEKVRELVRELKQELKEAVKNGDENLVENLKAKIDDFVNQGKGEVFEYDKYSKKFTPKNLEGTIQQAATEALQKVEDMQQVLEMQDWGSGLGDVKQSGGVNEKIISAKKLLKSKNFKKIIEQAGRLKLLAEAKRKSKSPNQAVIVGVKTGDDLFNLLPVEYGKFAHHKTRKLFIKDYSEKSLLEFEKSNSEKSKKGPVVVLIDNSGSMSGHAETWSKAVAITYLMMCSKDKRDFHAIHFDDCSRAFYDFPKGKFDDVKLGNFVNFFSGGGTDWERPLTDAVNIIEKNKQFKNADIVLITDDLCKVSQQWLDNFNHKKSELKFTSYGILIGTNNKGALDKFMDKVISIPNLSDDSGVIDIFYNIAKL